MEKTELAGKVVVITGGGTGIGRGIALALAGAGAQVVVSGRRPEPLEETVDAIGAAGGTAMAIPADVADEADVQQLVAITEESLGPIDILVNNAGIGGGGPIHAHSVDVWDQIMAINLRGPFLIARAVLPSMREREQGHIVNISSEAALEHYPGNGAYGVAKHGLNALSEYMQRENQDLGIRVDAVCPGMVVTEMTEDNPRLNKENALYPEDIADLVLWLVSRRPNVKIGRPLLIQTMASPWHWE